MLLTKLIEKQIIRQVGMGVLILESRCEVDADYHFLIQLKLMHSEGK
jgi:hypothetical protein